MTNKKGIIKKIVYSTIGTVILFVLIVIINLIVFEKNGSVVSKGQPIENYGKQKAALLVIDIQEATTGDVSTNVFFKENSDNLIKNINRITESFKNRNIPSIYIRSEITNPLINLLNSSFAKGSLGSEFDKRMNAGYGVEIVKNREDSFRNNELDNILSFNKINELYIIGLDAAECINATVEAAQNRKYKVNLIEEAILSKSKEMKDSMIAIFKNKGVNVIKMDSLIIME
jgi:nicotinamidase/pyrazinamidase